MINIKLFIKKPNLILLALLKRISFLINDKYYLIVYFKLFTGKKLNLKNPLTFSEKMQWLKLYDRKDKYTIMADKAEVKNYLTNIISKEYLIPTLGVWNSFDEIDFKSLPKQFVLKTTHDQGGVVICKDKDTFDFNNARKELNKHLRRKFFYQLREWPYKNIKQRIMAEEYLQDNHESDLSDFKFLCFNGKPKALYIVSERNRRPKVDFFDISFNHLNISFRNYLHNDSLKKPGGFEKMIELSKIISKDIPFLRVDFYYVNNKVFVGELTFFPHGGFAMYKPYKWELLFGSWIKLPPVR